MHRFLLPLPIQPLKPFTLGGPAPGMATEVVDDSGHPVRGQMGHLVCTKPAPSMTRGVWGDPARYLETYWSRWPGVAEAAVIGIPDEIKGETIVGFVVLKTALSVRTRCAMAF